MKDILDEIIASKRIEVEQYKQVLDIRQLYNKVEPMLDSPVPSMAAALKASDTGIIAEFKRKSPSKGWINKAAKAAIVPKSYQDNGAAALSILTDHEFFGGYDEFIQEARATKVTLPILYKNFIIDDYQLLLARHAGASAVLLIAADLTKEECRHLLTGAHQLGMEVLLEVHSEAELDYADLEPDMCGVNNRNLGTFVTDVGNSFRMAELLPENIVRVSESGISNPQTIRELRSVGYRGFLIGERFMREENPGEALGRFIKEINEADGQ